MFMPWNSLTTLQCCFGIRWWHYYVWWNNCLGLCHRIKPGLHGEMLPSGWGMIISAVKYDSNDFISRHQTWTCLLFLNPMNYKLSYTCVCAIMRVAAGKYIARACVLHISLTTVCIQPLCFSLLCESWQLLSEYVVVMHKILNFTVHAVRVAYTCVPIPQVWLEPSAHPVPVYPILQVGHSTMQFLMHCVTFVACTIFCHLCN